MMIIDTRQRRIKIVLVLACIFTLSFIFINSMLPPEISSEESGAMGGFLAQLFPEGTFLYKIIVPNIRKIAHFAEFFVLGAEIALYICIFVKRFFISIPASVFFLQTIALLDETVQIFSGRGPSISDVWIDFFGGASAYLIIYLIYFLLTKRNNGRTK